jgi:hypothetical protein
VNIKKAEAIHRERRNIEYLDKTENILSEQIDRLKIGNSLTIPLTETEEALLHSWDYVRRVKASLEQHKIK